LSASRCLYPNCTHLNDDEGRTDLCGCHLQELLKIIKRKKRKNPNFYRGISLAKLIEQLTKTQILTLLNVEEGTIKNIVSKTKPPYDFDLVSLGIYRDEEDKRNLKIRQFKAKYFNMVGGKERVFCSVFFIYLNKKYATEMMMFRTRTKHLAGELEKRMISIIVPRLKEIIFAQQGYPLNEWDLHVSYDGHYYHYEL